MSGSTGSPLSIWPIDFASAPLCAASPSAPGSTLLPRMFASLMTPLAASLAAVGHAPVMSRVRTLPAALTPPPRRAPETPAPMTFSTACPLAA